MPRQIIDVESSRPAYVRRNVMLAALVILIVAVAVYFIVLQRQQAPASSHPYGGTTQKSGQRAGPAANPPGK